MKTNLILITLLFLTSFTINAQESDDFTNYRIIKYSPTSLANSFFPSIQFSFEHNINESQALQYELGGIYLRNGYGRSINPLTTHTALAEYRVYETFMGLGDNRFQGVGIRFQKQYVQGVEQEVGNGLLEVTTSFSTIGLYYTRGRQRQYKKMMLEVGFRAGVQYVDYSIYNIPDGLDESYFTNNSVLRFNPIYPALPMLHIFFKVGFTWKA